MMAVSGFRGARFPERSAAILAGGESSRMGTNKALIEIGGCGLLLRTARLLRPLVDDLLLIANDPAPYADLGIPVVPDVYPGRGTIGGIHAALTRATHPLLLVVACDMPQIAPGILELLLGRAGTDWDALIPRVAGRPEPLLAVYRRSALPGIERSIAAGRLRIMDAVEGLRLAFVEEEELAAADPGLGSFVNVNTPADLAAARAAVQEPL